ncbi:hypothetical protein BD626DRAFT_553106 [Schizophyllum amplum]|uniref:CxC2-like cysteine cluster KDZ transposase-associated domain-containing protein n=1 Tax=Schizophyllum amplum TaxID=97359 RepID=A0A550BRU5_9AGAR|nr:hypothetical protein BD626DRAFT_553106 [Auriculariopsis ampla]
MSNKKGRKPVNVYEYDLNSLRAPRASSSARRTAESQHLSRDDRRRRTEEVQMHPSPPKKKCRLSVTTTDASEMLQPPDDEVGTLPRGGIIGSRTGMPWKRKYYQTADEPLRTFIPYADEYVEEFVRLDGRGSAADQPCPTCPLDEAGSALYRCTGCMGISMYCASCIVQNHGKRPFCAIERWDGGDMSFHRHLDGEQCEHSTLVNKDFTIMDITGVHQCTVLQCGCTDAPTLRQQLLRHRLFPASATAPRTACTFTLLDHFHYLTHHGKMTMYDFYNALERMTDNLGVSGLKVRRRVGSHMVIARCIREWKYLMGLKRGGRGNDCPGELAIRCPACPIPGENLPEGWDKISVFLAIALDACFRLKRRQVSSVEKDPRLLDGGAYIVQQQPFDNWIKTADKQDETTSSCSGLSALENANSKFAKGYAETGKGIGVCARHEFVQPNGVVPLQVGERYANMDYALASLLKFHSPLLKVILSYDIACQFSKNLVERVKKLPPLLRFVAVARTMRFVIPKLHILGHRLVCQLLFNLAYLFGGARTDGEGVERPWAHLGPLGTSLRQMGPGTAADTLDDHLSHWNWLKLIALGAFLLRKLLEALKEESIQRAEFEAFSRAQANNVPTWRASVLAFEMDNSKPNPFEMPKCGATEADVQLDMAKEQADAAARGSQSAHELSPGDFVRALLDIEDQQRSLARDVTVKTYATPKQQAELFRQRSKLSRAIAKLRPAVGVYMPPALARLEAWEAIEENAALPAEQRPLFPPSALSAAELTSCLGDVADIERRLRDAQCRVSLDAIRNLLLAKSRELRFKNTNVRHQGSTTRARNVIKLQDDKIYALARKYLCARSALLALAGEGASSVQWRALDINRDLRCLEEDDGRRTQQRAPEGIDGTEGAAPASNLQGVRDGTGEGRRTVSWIWYGTNTRDPDAQGTELYEGVRVEWCKAYARLRRWQEQIPLLREEMRRTTVSLKRREEEWELRRTSDTREGALGEGARAYAARQQRVYVLLREHFTALWAKAPATTQIDITEAMRIEEELNEGDDDTPQVDIDEDEDSESEEED